MDSYWTRNLRNQIGRRRVLAASGSGLVAAALLAACGGSSSGSDKQSGSSLIYTPIDTTKQAKKGGTYKAATGEETTTWDPTQSGAQLRAELFSTLLRPKSAAGQAPIGEYEGDLAESWEVSPDKLTLTFKIRPNAHFAPGQPTNGRAVDIDDVKQSFDYYEQVGNRTADIFNSHSPGAPLLSVTTPDARTLVLKLKNPDVVILSLLAGSTYPVVLAKEGIGGKFDLRGTPAGSGPLYVKDHLPSQRTVLEANPAYHLSGPNITTWEWYYIKEYATLLAEFRGGNIYTIDDQDARPPDLLPTKRAVPQLNVVKEDVAADQGQQFFGYRDGPISIFRDERVRQALSMSYDRDLWIDTFYNVSNFAKDGLPVATRWSLGGISANVQGRWLLDPQNKVKGQELGESAKYFEHNIAEAKKLLAAAGYANGVESESHNIVTADYGANHPKMIEVLLEMAQDAGFRVKIVPEAYATSYRNRYRDVKGDFEGTSFVRVSLNNEDDPTNRFYSQYHHTGDLFKGFDVDGKVAGKGDPLLDDLVTKMRQEFDLDKRIALSWDVQRQDAKKAYYIRFPGGSETFSMAWPVVGNYGVYKGGAFWWSYWLDQTKPPLKKA